ncbi:MAG: methyl-accepting chemotaxis protein, partial [Clostridiales bacterium]|nr:methyl-accepting chemotaxis protein [Clostridiales bacterium]
MKASLRIKILLMVFICVAVPVGVLGTISYTRSQAALQEAAAQSTSEQVLKTIDTINVSLNALGKYVQALSFDENVIKAAKGDVAYKDSAYGIIVKLQESNKDFVETMGFANSSGVAIMNNDNPNWNANVSDRAYIMAAIGGTPSMSEVVISKVTNNPVVAIAYPLVDNNTVVGCVFGTINFAKLTEYVESIKVGKSGYGYMINRKGMIINHPKSEKEFKEDVSKTTNKELKVQVDRMIAGETGEGFYTYEGVYKYVSYAPVGTDWVVAATANYDDYMSSAKKIRNVTMLTAILSLLIAVAGAWLYATRSIVKPVKQLEMLMTAAGEGDLRVKSKI